MSRALRPSLRPNLTASLSSLPAPLRQIIGDPLKQRNGKADERLPREQRWLPIRRTLPHKEVHDWTQHSVFDEYGLDFDSDGMVDLDGSDSDDSTRVKPSAGTKAEAKPAVKLSPVEEQMMVLCSLSQTCKTLRALALPVLWSTVDIRTVDELARITKTLTASPSLAAYVRHFRFT